MKDFSVQVNQALLANSEEELEAAGLLFEEFIELLQDENFEDFDSLYRLAIFLIQSYWPDSGMFAEISSQLFAEYDLGSIDWIWQNPEFAEYCLKFLDTDIHFGCFVLTEDRSNEKFTEKFAQISLNEECQICAEIGDGWLGPKAYVCENSSTPTHLLPTFSQHALNLLENDSSEERYEAVMMLRSLAGNPNTPKDVLEKLQEIHEQSIRHEIRNSNSGMDPDTALKDSFVDFKAQESLKNLENQ